MRPGDWSCTNCGAEKVYASRTHCNKCGAARPGLPAQQLQQGAPPPQLQQFGGKGEGRPGDWTCPACGAGPVFATRDSCFKCGSPRPAGAGGMVQAAEPSSRYSPYGAPPPPAAASAHRSGKGFGKGPAVGGIKDVLRLLNGGMEWKNDENTLVFQGLPVDTVDLDLYAMCSRFGPIAPGGVHVKADKGSGRCSGMGLVNFMDQRGCTDALHALNGLHMPSGALLTARIWSHDGPARAAVEERPGDWTCNMCGAGPNFASRTACFKCGAPKVTFA